MGHRLVLVAMLVVAAATPSSAAPGDLDPTFGVGGIVITPVAGQPAAIAEAAVLQPDGKIVVLQTVSVRRGCPRVASNMVTLNVSPPSTPGFMFEINVPLTFGFSNVATNHIYSATQNVSVYLEAGTIVSLAGSSAGNCDGGGTPLVYLFGYSVPATSASLAP